MVMRRVRYNCAMSFDGYIAGLSDANRASAKTVEMIAAPGGWRGMWLAEVRRLIHEVDSQMYVFRKGWYGRMYP